MTTTLDEALLNTAEALYDKMDALLPEPEIGKGRRLLEAMRYVALSHGKRLRPFLTVSTANLFGVSKSSALQTAAAIEFIHAYSLVHDDLPAMDDDNIRRGQPSCHVKYDEATAILVGDSLLTLAFEIISDPSTHFDAQVRCELIEAIAKASGHRGMVGGQMLDLSANHNRMSINEITRLQRMKTGALFVVSCEAGAILGKASKSLRNAVRGYANDLGLAFQITDDLLDQESDADERMDKSAGKATFVSMLGVDKAREQAKILSEQAIRHLHMFDSRADILRELAHFLVDRKQ